LNSPGGISRKWRYRYDIGYYYNLLSLLCHIVYATIGLSVIDQMFNQLYDKRIICSEILLGMYSITKAGFISMTKGFARELAAKKIRVNALLPGLTKTDLSKALFEMDEIRQHVIAEIPLQRHAEPHEMAGAVLYLVSDAASFTTGICLTCDGGYLA